MTQDYPFDPPHFDRFYVFAFTGLVRWFISHGVTPAHAEDIAQEVLIPFFAQHLASPEQVTNPLGWIFRCAEWRLTDWRRRNAKNREMPIEAQGEKGMELEHNPIQQAADLDILLWARQLVERNEAHFFELFEERAGTYDGVAHAVLQLATTQAPDDRVMRFSEGRRLVFSGGKKDDEKRERADVLSIAEQLGMTPAYVRTALCRLQPVWHQCELDTLLAPEGKKEALPSASLQRRRN